MGMTSRNLSWWLVSTNLLERVHGRNGGKGESKVLERDLMVNFHEWHVAMSYDKNIVEYLAQVVTILGAHILSNPF